MTSPTELADYCLGLARRARAAAQALAVSPGALKDRWLRRAADALLERQHELLAANEHDLAAARDLGLEAAALDRLRLTPDRLRAAAAGLREVATLPDPVGQVREGH